MSKFIPTGRALVYRHGNPKPVETDLETAKAVYCGQDGYEVFQVLKGADDVA